MLKAYFNLFQTVTFIRISLLILLLFALIVICIIIIIILLDAVYRPNIVQYPFNFFLDRIIPIIALISPTLLILFFSPFDAWFTRFTALLCIHIFILIPLFHYWSSLRRWNDKEDEFIYSSWNHPRLYLHIAIAIIYPSLWGIYFSLSRYIRLGSTVDLYEYITLYLSYMDWVILSIFLFPFYSIWIRLGLWLLQDVRLYLWYQLSSLLYSIHIFLIQYSIYFFLMEKLFKFSFLIVSLISLRGPVFFKEFVSSRFRRLINYLFYYPIMFDFLFISSLLIELILSKGNIYFGIYTLFIYPVIRSLLSSFFILYYQDWFHQVCFSDYINSNFTFPHYPLIFWTKSQEAQAYYGFEYELSAELLTVQEFYIKRYSFIVKNSCKLNTKILQSKDRYPIRFRFASSFYSQNQIRFVHSKINKLHSATSLFMRNIYDRINLINDSWRNLSRIQYLDKNKPISTPTNLYSNINFTYPLKKTTMIGIQEENLPTNFIPLMEHNVVVEPYNKALHTSLYLSQPNPDLYLGFSQSYFLENRNLTLDLKTNAGLGRNHILAEISVERYRSTLNRHRTLLDVNSLEINLVLDKLLLTCEDFNTHQLIWAKNLHLFPTNSLPPLRLPQNFNTLSFTQETLIELHKSSLILKIISDELFKRKVPNVCANEYPKEAYELLEDSFIQKLLGEDQY